MPFTPDQIKFIDRFQCEVLRGVFAKRWPTGPRQKYLEFDIIAFHFTSGSIKFTCNGNTDEIVVEFIDASDVANIVYDNDDNNKMAFTESSVTKMDTCDHFDLFRPFVGKHLGWLWDAKNDRGYRDMVAISFDGPLPELALYGLASAIAVYKFDRVRLVDAT